MAERAAALPLPLGASERLINWRYVAAVGTYHLLALLAFVPWFYQQGRRRARFGRRLCLRRLRHEPLLSSPARPSQLQVSTLAGTCIRASGGLVRGGYAGALGRDAPHAPSSFRRTPRSAQPAGEFLLVAYGLAVSAKYRPRPSGRLRPLCARHPPRRLLSLYRALCRVGHALAVGVLLSLRAF